MSESAIAKLPPIVIHKQVGPPPEDLAVRDLREGTGVAVRAGDAILVNYFSASFGAAAKGSRKGAYGEVSYTMSEVIRGWKLGLPGMRVGGRRQLMVPAKLAYPGGGVQIYVIDLLAVNRQGLKSFEPY